MAIKLLTPDLTRDETAKQRFLQEAQAASALDHPNICTIHEINETDDGQLYLVLAYYEGETLKERIERGIPSVQASSRNMGIAVLRGRLNGRPIIRTLRGSASSHRIRFRSVSTIASNPRWRLLPGKYVAATVMSPCGSASVHCRPRHARTELGKSRSNANDIARSGTRPSISTRFGRMAKTLVCR